jgi:tetratricopeptide (TPR) repeat protein
MELIGATRLYWLLLGQYELSYQLSGHVLTLPGSQVRSLARQRALRTLGQMGTFAGHSAAVTEVLEESLSIARELSDTQGMAETLHDMGNASTALGNDQAAVRHFEEAFGLAKELGNDLLTGILLNNWAECLRASGDLESAETLYEKSLLFKRRANNPHSAAIGLLNLAQVAMARGRLPRAREWLLESLAVISESQFPVRPSGFALETCAAFMATTGDWRNAARMYGACEAERERLGEVRGRADEQSIAALMAHVHEALGDAECKLASSEGARLAIADALSQAQAWLSAES